MSGFEGVSGTNEVHQLSPPIKESAMIESPLIQELLEQRSKQVRNEAVLLILTERFGPVSERVASAVKSIQNDASLAALIRFAAICLDLGTFLRRLESAS